MIHPFKNVYNDRLYGIYVHGINRFILIDDDDLWITIKTAQAISSKAVTSVCVLPRQSLTDNSLTYTIFNEAEANNISIIRQLPQLRIYEDATSIIQSELPVEGISELQELKSFVEYVHRIEYILFFLNALHNTFSNREFAATFIGDTASLSTRADQSNTADGIVYQIQRVLYLALTIEEIREQVMQLFKHHRRQKSFILQYYEVLDEVLPVELEFVRSL